MVSFYFTAILYMVIRLKLEIIYINILINNISNFKEQIKRCNCYLLKQNKKLKNIKIIH